MRSLLFIAVLLFMATTGIAAERTWTGGGGTGTSSWESPLNWGGTAPVAGDSLIFPSVTHKTASNTFTAGTAFGPVTIDAGGYVLTGNLMDLNGGIFLNGANGAQVTLPLEISVPVAFNVSNGNGILTISQTISGSGAVIKAGAGSLVFISSHTYTGGTIIDAGLLQVGGNVSGVVQIRNGFLIGTGSVDGITSLNQGADVAGASPGINGTAGTLTVDGDVTLFSDDNLYFSLGSSTSDKLAVNGSVHLGGCGLHFDLLSTPALNADIVVIDNDSTDPLVYDASDPSNYLFNLTIGGMPFQFRTVGGTNNNDLLVRRVASSAFTMTLDSNDADDAINHGNPVTFTAQVIGAVAGTPFSTTPASVSFWDGNEYLGTSTINGFQVQFTTSNLKPGLRKITAMFEGNTANAPVRSAIYAMSVQGTVTTTTLSAVPATSPVGTSTPGEQVTLIATVSPSPSGTVRFFDNGVEIGMSTVSGTQATFATSALLSGTHSLTATFVPNVGTSFISSTTASPVIYTVTGATTTTTLTTSGSPAVAGSDVTLTAAVASATTGVVEFRDGGAVLATVPVNGAGNAALTTSGLSAGTHSITAHYLGTTAFSPSATSSALSQVITARPDGSGSSGGGDNDVELSGGCGLGSGVAGLAFALFLLMGLRLRRH